jgi:hypothetical protein
VMSVGGAGVLPRAISSRGHGFAPQKVELLVMYIVQKADFQEMPLN